jgi:hypothetical protein
MEYIILQILSEEYYNTLFVFALLLMASIIVMMDKDKNKTNDRG